MNEAVLKKVLEWCTHHKGDPPASADDDSDSRKKTTDIDEWDQKFMQVDQEMLFEIILVRTSYYTPPISGSLYCARAQEYCKLADTNPPHRLQTI